MKNSSLSGAPAKRIGEQLETTLEQLLPSHERPDSIDRIFQPVV